MQPLVSVLLPAYRAQSTILAAVNSVLAGGVGPADLEILLEADDGYDYPQLAHLPFVKLAVCGQVATGVGAARNRALARAKGRYITYLDADDLWQEGWLSAILPLAQRDGLGGSPLHVIENDGEVLRAYRQDLSFSEAARTGASMRGLMRAELCPPFAEDLAQDIHHMLGVLAQIGGRARVSDRAYLLQIKTDSVTAQSDFSARVHQAYLRYIAEFEQKTQPFAKDCADVFRAKIALNAAYEASGQAESYYSYLAQRL